MITDFTYLRNKSSINIYPVKNSTIEQIIKNKINLIILFKSCSFADKNIKI
jgi:hypothetical protein